MKKSLYLISVPFLTAAAFAESSNANVPENCVFGRDRDAYNYSISLEESQNFYQASSESYSERSNQENAELYTEIYNTIKRWVEDSDYLRIEGPDYVIVGNDRRFKANLFDPYSYVKFFTDQDGYVGRDKSNLEANAYRTYSFPARGVALTWVTDGGLCSAKAVGVQSYPQVNATDKKNNEIVRFPNYNTVSFIASVDDFSMAGMKEDTKLKVRVGVQYDYSGAKSYTPWKAYDGISASDTISFRLPEGMKRLNGIWVEVHDGTYWRQDNVYTREDTSGGCRTSPCFIER